MGGGLQEGLGAGPVQDAERMRGMQRALLCLFDSELFKLSSNTYAHASFGG